MDNGPRDRENRLTPARSTEVPGADAPMGEVMGDLDAETAAPWAAGAVKAVTDRPHHSSITEMLVHDGTRKGAGEQ